MRCALNPMAVCKNMASYVASGAPSKNARSLLWYNNHDPVSISIFTNRHQLLKMCPQIHFSIRNLPRPSRTKCANVKLLPLHNIPSSQTPGTPLPIANSPVRTCTELQGVVRLRMPSDASHVTTSLFQLRDVPRSLVPPLSPLFLIAGMSSISYCRALPVQPRFPSLVRTQKRLLGDARFTARPPIVAHLVSSPDQGSLPGREALRALTYNTSNHIDKLTCSTYSTGGRNAKTAYPPPRRQCSWHLFPPCRPTHLSI